MKKENHSFHNHKEENLMSLLLFSLYKKKEIANFKMREYFWMIWLMNLKLI